MKNIKFVIKTNFKQNSNINYLFNKSNQNKYLLNSIKNNQLILKYLYKFFDISNLYLILNL